MLIKTIPLQPEGVLGIWEIAEPEYFFVEGLQLTAEEEDYASTLMDKRRLEWLAGRYLLHVLSGRDVRGACIRDDWGKPHLQDSLYEISISHTTGRAAVIAGPKPVGVDIQELVEKIERIAQKFMRPDELESLRPPYRLEHLHVYWGAKESLYKAYGKRQLDFREHIFIQPFSFQPEGGHFSGWIVKDTLEWAFEGKYAVEDGYSLTYAVRV